MDSIAGRIYVPTIYSVSGRRDIHEFLCDSVTASGGKLLYATEPNVAPVFLGIQDPATDERIGVLVYHFRCNAPPIRGRAPDEHRVQIRYGDVNNPGWRQQDHRIGLDVAGVDTTVVLGCHLDERLLVGLDPLLYESLPMGISIEFKQADVDAAKGAGWHSWERVAVRGRRRGPRTEEGIETLIAFAPSRLLDFVRLERHASALGLDPPLRLRAAQALTQAQPAAAQTQTFLREMGVSPDELISIIEDRKRLRIAFAGGVAEHHLQRHLLTVPGIRRADLIDRDGRPDLEVELGTGRVILVECKNASPRTYADGTPKVEIQKTRSTRDDPAGRLYRPDQFDVVAACMYPLEREWSFRFKLAQHLQRHDRHPDRVKPLQRVDETWAISIERALS